MSIRNIDFAVDAHFAMEFAAEVKSDIHKTLISISAPDLEECYVYSISRPQLDTYY